MVVLATLVFGLISYQRLGLGLLPDISYPTLTVRTELEGAAPQEVEELVTRPLEESLSTLEGLVSMSSRSRPGGSDVVLEFGWGSRVDLAAQRVRERLALATLLTEDAGKPLLLRFDPSLDPILRLAVHGEADLFRLREAAEHELKPALERLPGVAMVRVRGGRERLVRVELSEQRLALLGLSVAEVAQRIAAQNVNLPGGRLSDGGVEFLVRTVAELRAAEELSRLVIRTVDGSPIRLGSLGSVGLDAREPEVLSRLGGRECVELEVHKEADAHLVNVSDTVQTLLRALARATERAQREAAPQQGGEPQAATDRAPTRPPGPEEEEARALAARLGHGVQVALLSDAADYIRGALTDLRTMAISGGLLAVLLLLLFLRDLRATLIVAASIPVSLVAAFIPMMLLGVSLNLMSLGGLALGVGMLVDNSIVVLESITRCREEGDSLLAAAARGTREVGGAVTASTLTTVAVFFPIVFVEGVAGQVFGDLAMAVVFSLLASLAVALFLVPMLASRGLSLATPAPRDRAPEGAPRPARWRALELAASDLRRLVARISGDARSWVRVALAAAAPLLLAWILVRTVLGLALDLARLVGELLARPLLALAGLAGRLRGRGGPAGRVARALKRVHGLAARGYGGLLDACLRRPSRALLPSLALLGVAAWQSMSLGAELMPELHRGELTVRVECPAGTALETTSRRVRPLEHALLAMDEVERVVVTVGSEQDRVADRGEGEHTARISVVLRARSALAAAERRVAERARTLAAGRPGLSVEIGRPEVFSLKPAVEVEALGHDLEDLARAGEAAQRVLLALPTLSDVRSSHGAGLPELRVVFRRDELSRRGMDLRATAEALAHKLRGLGPTALRADERRQEVWVRVAPQGLDSVAALARLDVGQTGQPVPLSAVASVEPGTGPSEIRRIDGTRAVVLQARSRSVDLGSVAADLRRTLDGLVLPPGVTVRLGGQSDEMERSLGSLRWALLLAVFLVYIVMAATFESVASPFVVLAAVPLAGVGVVAALRWTGTPLSVVTLLGAIVLVGVVVNNAIVLVDYALRLRRRGLDGAQALATAGRVRLRPILISSWTTVLGLLPLVLADGRGAEIQRPMALTVVTGLLLSTLLTLLVVPAALRATLFRRGDDAPAAPPAPRVTPHGERSGV